MIILDIHNLIHNLSPIRGEHILLEIYYKHALRAPVYQ